MVWENICMKNSFEAQLPRFPTNYFLFVPRLAVAAGVPRLHLGPERLRQHDERRGLLHRR